MWRQGRNNQFRGNAGIRRSINPVSATNSNENNNAERSSGARRKVYPQKSSFDLYKLKEITEKCPEEALLDLIDLKDKILVFVNNDLSNDCIVQFIKLFTKILEANFTKNIADILRILINPVFVKQLESFITQLPVQNLREITRTKLAFDEINEFLTNLKILSEGLLRVIPKKSMQFLPQIIKLVLINIPHIEKGDFKVISDDFEKLQVRIEEIAQNNVKVQLPVQCKEETEPLNNFRDINIYPSCDELLAKSSHGLRKNKIEGCYANVEQYLDIQFRLLREDFVAPLRQGIAEYMTTKNGNDCSNIKVYKDVICLRKEYVNTELGVVIQFEKRQIRNPETTKRLMFGSLVIFTSDNFETMIFGTVVNRDIQCLQNGQITVTLNNNTQLEFDKIYVMVECLVYFDPYYQVLKALQNKQHYRFPMEEYLVHVKKELCLPDYLTYEDKLSYCNGLQIDNCLDLLGLYEDYLNSSDDEWYDEWNEYPIVKRKYWQSIRNEELYVGELNCQYTLPMVDRHRWPEPEKLKLNPSQYNAFKAAVTNKFCIIQGPPGTGKTYVSLKIANLLLQNKDKWKGQGPMLVICYTNHALDQFLEGLLPTTKKLVRVGGQSKSNKLKDYQLNNHRKAEFLARIRRNKKNKIYHVEDPVQNVKRSIDSMKLNLTLLERKYYELVELEGIPNLFNTYGFEKIDPDFHDSWFKAVESSAIINWLMEGSRRYYRHLEQNDNIEEEQEYLALKDRQISFIMSYRENNEVINYTLMSMMEMDRKSKSYAKEERRLIWLLEQREYFKRNMEMLKDPNNEKPQNVDYNFPKSMPHKDRWGLLRYWINRYKEFVKEEIKEAEEKIRERTREYQEMKEISDSLLMKQFNVVGMTTTCAARLQKTLMVLDCPIVIVEEAAEVLEAHIVTALTKNCQHLILIGDHKQLRPSTADYNIDKRYHLGISLFERMVLNDFNTNTLNIQHRMRPEIAALITPSIYSTLENHTSVLDFEPIRGIQKSVYFITHNNPESESHDQSKENVFEAAYIIKLANHLVLNYYEPSKITILSAYSGQFFQLLKERKNYETLTEVNITILDNYQGEENDIILLSLVRNNNEGKIGFLKLENRVCVALSRAKYGLYIMGNIDLLCNNSEIWPKIRKTLEKNDSLGTGLPLTCRNHPDNQKLIVKIEDFEQVREGGCNQICNSIRGCGHRCTLMCHNLLHSKYPCNEPCTKILCTFGHQCPKLCHEECGECIVPKMETLPCGHEQEIPCYLNATEVTCRVMVDVTLKCGHENKKYCSKPLEECRCVYKCKATIERCGHVCELRCHSQEDPRHLMYECKKRCEKPNVGCSMPEDPLHKCKKLCYENCSRCEVKVRKTRTVCPHSYHVKCTEDVDEIICVKPVTKLMKCGHTFTAKCFETSEDCRLQVTKVIEECGHEIICACSEEPLRKDCEQQCNITFSCGHKCISKCNVDCKENKCMELIELTNKKSSCGHIANVPCHKIQTITDEDILQNCQEKCSAILECGHQCSGNCGSCRQGRLHVPCMEKCNRTLICGHECNNPCQNICLPCTSRSLYCKKQCKNDKKCGEKCLPCTIKRKTDCPHDTSKTMSPCTQHCPKKLLCGHNCIGYCGDICPSKCLICNKEEIEEMFLGAYFEGARFVYLQECGHVLEGSSLDQLFKNEWESSAIQVMMCPKCKTPVTQTKRYSDYFKRALSKLNDATQEFNRKMTLTERLKLRTLHNESLLECKKIDLVKPILSKWNKTYIQQSNKQHLIDLIYKRRILNDLYKTYTSAKVTKVDVKTVLDKSLKYLLKYLDTITNISNQMINDYSLERKRFTRIKQLCEIMENSKADYQDLPEYTESRCMLFSINKFSDEQEQSVSENLRKLNEKTMSEVNITENEIMEVVAMRGMCKGYWFECPAGHIYSVKNCEDAIDTNKCDKCNEELKL